ncbi:TPA: hypothetical protein DEO28_04835 [Candidatus Dependentiae bacterium]|nr:MAG: hypothetical protein UR14_C0002G0080 [candidate division TM6 bacterium GW2011_GWE2_31_21]KKP53877.1 MAG: hypothetical protein UR43_C0002G0080 [candidate division TM6 bacterium GW2011_GWF2_33_332]HBS47657.1 hypothetical protein [Candidatus Dependentiae bacterium]HBZ73806.1 hypothetical protein [Candidatus Dependentiae bacterium]
MNKTVKQLLLSLTLTGGLLVNMNAIGEQDKVTATQNNTIIQQAATNMTGGYDQHTGTLNAQAELLKSNIEAGIFSQETPEVKTFLLISTPITGFQPTLQNAQQIVRDAKQSTVVAPKETAVEPTTQSVKPSRFGFKSKLGLGLGLTAVAAADVAASKYFRGTLKPQFIKDGAILTGTKFGKFVGHQIAQNGGSYVAQKAVNFYAAHPSLVKRSGIAAAAGLGLYGSYKLYRHFRPATVKPAEAKKEVKAESKPEVKPTEGLIKRSALLVPREMKKHYIISTLALGTGIAALELYRPTRLAINGFVTSTPSLASGLAKSAWAHVPSLRKTPVKKHFWSFGK